LLSKMKGKRERKEKGGNEEGPSKPGAGKMRREEKMKNISTMIEVTSEGKVSDKLVDGLDELQIVKYDKRLASYVQTIFDSKAKKKGQTVFLFYEILRDVGIAPFRSFKFIFSLLLFFACFLIRVQVHYSAVFALLLLTSRPILEASPSWYRWTIRYSPGSTLTNLEVSLLCVGPASVFFLWFVTAGLFVLVSKMSKLHTVIYKFLLLFGIACVSDWFLTFIVDVASSAFSQCIPNGFADSSLLSRQQLKALSDVCNSEIYRIWYHFRLREGDGSVAPVIIFIVYMGLTSIETVMYYTYILNFHEDGRILDLYRRLIAKEGTLFCPLDVEVSPAELMTILQKSRRWRGKDGARRNLVVTEINVNYESESEEETQASSSSSTSKSYTHMAIYTCQKEGKRFLHRHFLRFPTGALAELVGDEVEYLVSASIVSSIHRIVESYERGEAA